MTKIALVEMMIDSASRRASTRSAIAAELQSKFRIPEHLQILQGKLEDIDRLLAE